MHAAKKLAGVLSRVWHADRVSRSGPADDEPRPMIGFYAGLADEQKTRALAYRGEEAHGGHEFVRRT